MVEFSIDASEYDIDTVTGRFMTFSKTAQFWHAFYPNGHIKGMQESIRLQREKEEENFQKTGKREIMLTRREIKKLRVCQ